MKVEAKAKVEFGFSSFTSTSTLTSAISVGNEHGGK